MMKETFGRHSQKVKIFFDNTHVYLRNSFGIQLRIDIVSDLLADKSFKYMVDFGCGDGSISYAILSKVQKATLVDLSPEMLKKAQQKLPVESITKVDFIEGDFQKITVSEEKYDLVMAIGLIAHVYDLQFFFKTVEQITTKNSYLLLQFTQYSNWLSRLRRVLHRNTYTINSTDKSEIVEALAKRNFKLIDSRRYGFILPGFGRLSNEFLYKYETVILNSKLLSKLGTDYMMLFQKTV